MIALDMGRFMEKASCITAFLTRATYNNCLLLEQFTFLLTKYY